MVVDLWVVLRLRLPRMRVLTRVRWFETYSQQQYLFNQAEGVCLILVHKIWKHKDHCSYCRDGDGSQAESSE
jgi:hypothetical protein